MDLTAQIPDVTVVRAANAPHYEYMTTFGKRTADLPVDHELWLPQRTFPLIHQPTR